MASPEKTVLSSPANLDQLHDNHVGSVISDQEAKRPVDIVAEPHIGDATTAVGTNDPGLEARLKRLEQLRNQYGVGSGHQIFTKSIANGLGHLEHLDRPR